MPRPAPRDGRVAVLPGRQTWYARRVLRVTFLRLGRISTLAFAVTCASVAGHAGAQEAKPALMSRPIAYTDVADAFEPGDPIDVAVHLGFLRSWQGGTIQREVVDESSGDGRSSRHLIDVAEHSQTSNVLALSLDVGVYHDLMVFVRMPIVLGQDEELQPPRDGCQVASTRPRCQALNEPVAGEPVPLFDLARPLTSARRSGLRSVDFGVAWGVMNQYRTVYLPTWVLRIEGSVPAGRTMHACTSDACNPGISRGTAHVKLESRWSYRYRLFEPYFGIAHTYEWVTRGDSVFYPAGRLAGVVNDAPPSVTEGTLGVGFIPWEDRGHYQRFELDLQSQAVYLSAGRDFSPLFDALGTSDNPHLSKPNLVAPEGPAPHTSVPFTGITNVEAHARLGLSAALAIQAARYVRFGLGLGISFLTSHLITGAPPCNGDVDAKPDDPRVGTCISGISNPVYRPAIDAPGRRFRLAAATDVQFAAAATGAF